MTNRRQPRLTLDSQRARRPSSTYIGREREAKAGKPDTSVHRPICVLGFDPSTTRTGWAFLDDAAIELGTLDLESDSDKTKLRDADIRLWKLYDEAVKLVRHFKPYCVGIEVPQGSNRRSAYMTAQAVAMIKLAALQNAAGIEEVQPAVLKKIVTGKGNATKSEVARFIALQTRCEPANDHEGDAAAVAVYTLDKAKELAKRLRTWDPRWNESRYPKRRR